MHKNTRIDVLDKGFVRLVDYMGDDAAIVQAARVSYAEGTKTIRQDGALIDYLMRHYHTTPFEMVELKFHIKMPLVVLAHFVRHRTHSMNANSYRYSFAPDEFFFPETFRGQSNLNKQESYGIIDDPDLMSEFQFVTETSFDMYQKLIDAGVAREMARMILPQNLYTEFYWKQDLHNLFHLLWLRSGHGESTAQQETAHYADAMFKLIQPIVPMATKSWEDNVLNAVTLNVVDIRVLNGIINGNENPFEGLSKSRTEEVRRKLVKILGEI